MVELPLKRFSESNSNVKFSCDLKSDSKSDDKVLKKLANEYNCSAICKFKDCFEHVMKYQIKFRKTEDKEAFLCALESCKDIVICTKLAKRYA